jgi:hypothetical protein
VSVVAVPPGRRAHGLEAEASSIRNFELAMVPGLLQTEDYARALISGGPMELDATEVERRVEVRTTRQQALDRDERPQLWVIVDEAAIRRTVGGPAVMRGQLEALVTAADQARTTIQVVPYSAGAHPGQLGPFVILGFPEPSEPEVVTMETVGGNLYVDKPEEVRLYTTAFDHLRAVALSPGDTRAMLPTAARTATASKSLITAGPSRSATANTHTGSTSRSPQRPGAPSPAASTQQT